MAKKRSPNVKRPEDFTLTTQPSPTDDLVKMMERMASFQQRRYVVVSFPATNTRDEELPKWLGTGTTY